MMTAMYFPDNGSRLSMEPQWLCNFFFSRNLPLWTLLITNRAMIVSFIAAELADRVGRKPVLLMALVVTFGAVAIEFCATTDDVFFVGKFLNGIMVGTIGSVMMSHIGEVTI